MTGMLVRIQDACEAALADRASVDIVEFVVDAHRPDNDVATAIRAAFSGRLRLRCGRSVPQEAILAIAKSVHADEISVAAEAIPSWFTSRAQENAIPVVAIASDCAVTRGEARGPDAIILETVGDRRLIDQFGIARLDAFASACRDARMRFGFAGGLEAPDVARLLLLAPDVLCFDRAVRVAHHADGRLDEAALAAIRALIPREDGRTHEALPRVAIDRIFVREFVCQLSIGAYQAEHGIRQRVRFGVEASVLREPAVPKDMRDVFSYDVIIETIRVLSQRPHVLFVESLAEEIAASLLAHSSLVSVKVRVEKLDVIDGAVGVEIVRDKPLSS